MLVTIGGEAPAGFQEEAILSSSLQAPLGKWLQQPPEGPASPALTHLPTDTVHVLLKTPLLSG